MVLKPVFVCYWNLVWFGTGTWYGLEEDEAGILDEWQAGPDQAHDVDQGQGGVQVSSILMPIKLYL
jgi:hypothetical protein